MNVGLLVVMNLFISEQLSCDSYWQSSLSTRWAKRISSPKLRSRFPQPGVPNVCNEAVAPLDGAIIKLPAEMLILKINERSCGCQETTESTQFSRHSITSEPGLLNRGLHQPANLGINLYTITMINYNFFCYVRMVWEQTLTTDGFVVGFFFPPSFSTATFCP